MSSFIYFCLSMILIHCATASEIELLVSNGNGFRPNVHNYLVMIRISLPNFRNILCSGSIIDKEWIITAAHCLPHNTKEIKIIQKIRSRNRVIGYGREYVNHPNIISDGGVNNHNSENDVALVRTSKPIEFNAYTQPIALSRLRAFGQQATIAGYGWSEFGSKIPIEGTVVVMPCKSVPQGSKKLCSQSLAYINKGDSGGALMTDDGLIGVAVASGTDNESIFVDISLHFTFIQQVMGKELHGICIEPENID